MEQENQAEQAAPENPGQSDQALEQAIEKSLEETGQTPEREHSEQEATAETAKVETQEKTEEDTYRQRYDDLRPQWNKTQHDNEQLRTQNKDLNTKAGYYDQLERIAQQNPQFAAECERLIQGKAALPQELADDPLVGMLQNLETRLNDQGRTLQGFQQNARDAEVTSKVDHIQNAITTRYTEMFPGTEISNADLAKALDAVDKHEIFNGAAAANFVFGERAQTAMRDSIRKELIAEQQGKGKIAANSTVVSSAPSKQDMGGNKDLLALFNETYDGMGGGDLVNNY